MRLHQALYGHRGRLRLGNTGSRPPQILWRFECRGQTSGSHSSRGVTKRQVQDSLSSAFSFCGVSIFFLLAFSWPTLGSRSRLCYASRPVIKIVGCDQQWILSPSCAQTDSGSHSLWIFYSSSHVSPQLWKSVIPQQTPRLTAIFL